MPRSNAFFIATLICASFGTAALADDVGDQKSATWTLRCATTAKSGADSVITGGTLELEITQNSTLQAFEAQLPAQKLEPGQASEPTGPQIEKYWIITTGAWKVAKFDPSHAFSFANKYQQLCAHECALHSWVAGMCLAFCS